MPQYEKTAATRALNREITNYRSPVLLSPPPYLPRRASDKKRGRDGTKYSKFHPRGYLSHHLAAISMAAVYTDAAHIADGVIGLKQRSLAASDPTE